LPPHLYPDTRYDKWGNPYLLNGFRLRGELFYDESVQKVLAPVLDQFTDLVKYPRTWHLPWSNPTKDDRVLSDDIISQWVGTEVVITEKMDGENTTMYRDCIHARSVDYSPHESRNWVRNLHSRIGYLIPVGMRICGENLWAKHSIGYDKLESYFLVFSIWEGTKCLSWEETKLWCALLDLALVPVLYQGPFNISYRLLKEIDPTRQEGYVIRPAGEFHLRDFPRVVGKYVRKDHVQTHGHWMRSAFTRNGLA
jgi:hypothetical protein